MERGQLRGKGSEKLLIKGRKEEIWQVRLRRMKLCREPFNYEVKAHYGVISKSATGWTKEVNLVSWNGTPPKLDVREWDPEHEHMSKGMTFRAEEAKELMKILEKSVAKLADAK